MSLILLLLAYLFGLSGTVLLWFFGLPQRDISRDGHIHLILEQSDEAETNLWKKYNRLSKMGILLIGVSFLLQMINLFI